MDMKASVRLSCFLTTEQIVELKIEEVLKIASYKYIVWYCTILHIQSKKAE